jgi:two-component system NarL family sensor kinase
LKPLIFFLALVTTCFAGLAQDTKTIDSLEQQTAKLKGEPLAKAYYELVYYYLRVDMEKAKKYTELSKNFNRETSDKSSLAYALMAQGIFFNRNGKLDSAVVLLEDAHQYGLQSKNDAALIRIDAALAYALISSGKPGKGLEYLFDALRVTERHPDKEMEMKLHTNIPWAYLELKQYKDCIHHGYKTLSLLKDSEYEWIALYTYNNMAVSYGALDKLDSARYFIDKGISAAEKIGDNQSLANGHYILGTIYASAGKPDLAIEQYLEARPYREKVGNPFFLVSDLYAVSDLYYEIGNYAKGVQAAKDALKLAEQFNLTLKFENTYLSLARNYEGLGDFKNSSQYYRLYAMAKDTVYKNSTAESIAEMQTRFETEKKEQQLALQKAELTTQQIYLERTYVIIGALIVVLVMIMIIFSLLRSRLKRRQLILEKEKELYVREAQIQASIQSQESERKRFARDLHDGMGQLISALRLTLQSVDRESSLEHRLGIASKGESILNEMYREIRSIAFNLMPQTLVQEGLIPALKEMSSRVNGSGEIMIRVSSYDMPGRLTEVQEISLYRIIQEWVNNVMKYAHATVVEIQLICHEDELAITIEDNGKGFEVSVLQQGSGNGWKNINSRLNLIKAVMDIDSRPGVIGTTLIIRLPLDLKELPAVATVSSNTQ